MSNIIKILRQQKGLTQEELGSHLGVKKSAIQKYESGAIVNLKAETIKKLCDLFDVAPSIFIYGSGSVNRFFVDTLQYRRITKKWADNDNVKEAIDNISRLNDFGVVKVNEYIKDLLRIEAYTDNGQ